MCWPGSHFLGSSTVILRQETKAERPSRGPGWPGPTRDITPEQGSRVHGTGCGRREKGHAKGWKLFFCTRNSLPKMLRETHVFVEAAGLGGTLGFKRTSNLVAGKGRTAPSSLQQQIALDSHPGLAPHRAKGCMGQAAALAQPSLPASKPLSTPDTKGRGQ